MTARPDPDDNEPIDLSKVADDDCYLDHLAHDGRPNDHLGQDLADWRDNIRATPPPTPAGGCLTRLTQGALVAASSATVVYALGLLADLAAAIR